MAQAGGYVYVCVCVCVWTVSRETVLTVRGGGVALAVWVQVALEDA